MVVPAGVTRAEVNLNSSFSGKHRINTSAGKFKVTNVEMV